MRSAQFLEFAIIAAQDATLAHSPEPLLKHLIRSTSPWIGFVFLLTSVFLQCLLVLLAMDIRRSVHFPPHLVGRFMELVNQRKYTEAGALCGASWALIARVLFAGMSRLQFGAEAAVAAARHELARLEHVKQRLLTILLFLAIFAPLFGVLAAGVMAVRIVHEQQDPTSVTPTPEMVPLHLARTLVLVIIGVMLGIIASGGYLFFKQRLRSLVLDIGQTAEDLLCQMHHGGTNPGLGFGGSQGPGGSGGSPRIPSPYPFPGLGALREPSDR